MILGCAKDNVCGLNKRRGQNGLIWLSQKGDGRVLACFAYFLAVREKPDKIGIL
jgi:hypothetical protein